MQHSLTVHLFVKNKCDELVDDDSFSVNQRYRDGFLNGALFVSVVRSISSQGGYVINVKQSQ